ncbi:hypothetical protein [Campylobacter sp.]|uniref:hypothetical protein n=1 Tax=Campylobacter sp. TaxID=205 RepID=UPI0026DC4235|nr:hypothetical protein [Campylobacter sp.]MDO4674434.1 hypothetical protein [Campylobacter sp.]
MGLLSSLKKRRRRFETQTMQRFDEISQKYGLNLNPDDYRYIAQALAKAKVKRRGLFGGFGILDLVFSIASIFTGGALGAAAFLGTNMLTSKNAKKAQNLAYQTQTLQRKIAWQKALNDKAEEGEGFFLRNLQAYPAYANGAIFKRGAAGSQSFAPSSAFDVTKGLSGQIKTESIDEMLTGRGHFTAAGNAGYMQGVGEGYIDAESGGLDADELKESLFHQAAQKHERILRGFVELAAAGFDFCGTANEHFQRVVEEVVCPSLRQICTLDFLEKNKNYNKALRLEIPLHLSALTQSKKLDKAEREGLLKSSDRFKAAIERDLQSFKRHHGEISTARLEVQRAEFERALLEEERGLYNDRFYIQKSRLFSLEEKQENYREMVETKVSLFLQKVGRVFYYEDERALNNAQLLGDQFFYTTDLKWTIKHYKSMEEVFAQLYGEGENSIVEFYEDYVLKNFAELEFYSGVRKKAFWIELDGKRWIKIVNDVSEILEPLYRGF